MSGSSGGGGASGEIVYNTFLDPTNTKDPRAIAQTAAIAAFEKANPKIKVRVNVDPPGANVGKAIAARADPPDVWRATNNAIPQFVKQRGIASLDNYIERDGLDREDWLLPLSLNQIDGETFCLQQDYRIPLFLYRADAYKAAGISTTPATFEDVKRVAGDLSAMGRWASRSAWVQVVATFPDRPSSSSSAPPCLPKNLGASSSRPTARTRSSTRRRFRTSPLWFKDLYDSKASTKAALNWGFTETHQALQTGSASSATFGVYRFNSLKSSGATDLAWAPAPAFDAAGKQAVKGRPSRSTTTRRRRTPPGSS